ncbi:yqcI protein [Nannizzia gypsea CBS 118893]|uniref:YqcI protein n=1 Tax=Arthroderma gypseum (strain ATCC MYA-4604 / CBS 118893) TaxID=535722 RepID=E4UU76_ARTGP|nr:yqcI protein [Nannizzia gypsea CBS 118893]EFR00843.1 yqcI protein [Nannizzia gypsea CBS 118893]
MAFIALALVCVLLYIIFVLISHNQGQKSLSHEGFLQQVTHLLQSIGQQKTPQGSKILKRKELEDTFGPTTWQRESYDAFQAAVCSTDPVAFPCVYATKGFKAKEHRYIFLDSEDMNNKKNISTLATALKEYLTTPHSALGPNTSLVVLFPIANSQLSPREYHQKYWDCLRALRKVDTKPWPANIPTDTDTPLWKFCFNGEPVFSAAMTPSHEKRRSRYAPCFCIVFQPNFVFDILFATELKKKAAISKVRGLLADFDEVPISPELKNYGDVTGRESKQYFIMDENQSSPPCPYTSLDV